MPSPTSASSTAARLAALTPGNLHTFKLVSGGSEATETAMKFARQYHRQHGQPLKYKIVSNYKGFHGATMGALSATGLGGQRKSVFGPFLDGFVHMAPPTCFRCPYRLSHPGCGMLVRRDARHGAEKRRPRIRGRLHRRSPSATRAASSRLPRSTSPFVRRICSAHDVLLIFDEVITGMGRTGNWFAAQTFETTPDILCLGKGMGGGYAPLAACGVRR